MTRNRSLVILAMIFVGLAALLAYQNEQRANTRATPETPYYLVFPDVAADDIQAIRLRSPETGSTFTLARDDSGAWTAPGSDGTLDAPAAAGIARTMQLLPYSRLLPLETDADLTGYGFAPEGILSVEFVMSDGTAHAVAVGYRTPTDNSYYGLIDDRAELYLLERPAIDYLIAQLRNPPIA